MNWSDRLRRRSWLRECHETLGDGTPIRPLVHPHSAATAMWIKLSFRCAVVCCRAFMGATTSRYGFEHYQQGHKQPRASD